MFLCMIKESAALTSSFLQVFNRGLSPFVPSEGGRRLFGDSFEVGKEINLSPKVNVYVNSPNGLVKRTYP